jgi:hypothetical protein
MIIEKQKFNEYGGYVIFKNIHENDFPKFTLLTYAKGANKAIMWSDRMWNSYSLDFSKVVELGEDFLTKEEMRVLNE